jgi:hypothetical protein
MAIAMFDQADAWPNMLGLALACSALVGVWREHSSIAL